MKKMYPNFTVTELCQLFEVSSSSFYYTSKISTDNDEELTITVKHIFESSGQTYGKRRIQVELKDLGLHVGLYKIANIMKDNKLIAIRPT